MASRIPATETTGGVAKLMARRIAAVLTAWLCLIPVIALAQDDTLLPDAPDTAACTLPTPSEFARIVLVGGGVGATLSNVALAGPDGTTTMATLDIEPGDGGLYLVATTPGSIVWTLTGAVERVHEFILPEGAGVAGLDPARVTFAAPGCIPPPFADSAAPSAQRAKQALSDVLNRPVDHIFAGASIGTVRLPSGTVELPETQEDRWGQLAAEGQGVAQEGGNFRMIVNGPTHMGAVRPGDAEELEQQLLNRLQAVYPGGIARLNARDITTAAPAETYDVLPGEAGLLLLLQSGAIVPGPDGQLVITRPIARLPYGFRDGRGRRYLLQIDVPLPPGLPDPAAVILDRFGRCLAGAVCN